MIKIISERHTVTHTTFSLDFELKEDRGSGYSFPLMNGNTIPIPCKKDENNPSEYIPCSEEECTWWKNYLSVKDDREHYEEPFVRKFEYTYTEPAKALCYCGEEIYLTDEYMGACQCPECGRWYNMFGQKLNRPEMWEVE